MGPSNSQRDRTLDQQCTVTRPGLAQIASGLAVELMVALLHSPRRQRTPALLPPLLAPSDRGSGGGGNKRGEENEGGEEECEPLPHMIRGVLGSFSQVNPVCSAFQHCTACSPAIVRKYWPPRAAQDGSHSHSDKDRDKDRDKDKDRDTESSFVSFVEEVGSTDTHIHTPTHTHLLHYFTC
jgi:hypothetical protein